MYTFADDIRLSVKDLLQGIDQQAAIEWIIGEPIRLNEMIANPFRKSLDPSDPSYDNSPGSKFEYWEQQLVLVDFAFKDFHSINAVRMTERWFSCSTANAISLLKEKFYDETKSNVTSRKVMARSNRSRKYKIKIIYTVCQDESGKYLYSPNAILYWQQYGITIHQLVQDKVYQISEYSKSLKSRKNTMLRKVPLTPGYVIVEKSGMVKIYCPEESNRQDKFCANVSQDDIGGTHNPILWYVIITKSYKDYRVLVNLGYNVRYFQNEGMKPDKKLLLRLFGKNKVIFLLFDNDAAGIAAGIDISSYLQEILTNSIIRNIRLINIYKDVSDHYKYLGEANLQEHLKQLIDMKDQIPFNFHHTWREHVEDLFKSTIVKTIMREALTGTYYPHSLNIFRAFNIPLTNIRVVMLGKDPYKSHSANGMAFAVEPDLPELPPTLEVLEQEVARIYKDPERPFDQTLSRWTNQGVLLLNSSLTIGENESHFKYWKEFVIHILKTVTMSNSAVILVSFGKQAQEVIKGLAELDPTVRSRTHYLHCIHPDAQFKSQGSMQIKAYDIFNEVNKIVTSLNGKPIIW